MRRSTQIGTATRYHSLSFPSFHNVKSRKDGSSRITQLATPLEQLCIFFKISSETASLLEECGSHDHLAWHRLIFSYGAIWNKRFTQEIRILFWSGKCWINFDSDKCWINYSQTLKMVFTNMQRRLYKHVERWREDISSTVCKTLFDKIRYIFSAQFLLHFV